MTAKLCTSHRYTVTFDHADETGHKREKCRECGCIRWTVNGEVVRESQPAEPHVTTITPSPAHNGSLAGWKVDCTCGDSYKLAFELDAQHYAAQHVAYMTKKG